ncbi:MAG: hypothetical protein QNJ58_11760 [Desulfobacterales bacterium]|nr:hypothetical protein [Desulfobacterales bacterium]
MGSASSCMTFLETEQACMPVLSGQEQHKLEQSYNRVGDGDVS